MAKRHDLEVLSKDDIFFIDVDGQRLKSPAGNEISSGNKAIIDSISHELSGFKNAHFENGILISPRSLSLYLIMSTEIDFVRAGKNPFNDILSCIQTDQMFSNTAGHPMVSMYQMESRGPGQDFLDENCIPYKPLHHYEPDEITSLEVLYRTAVENLSNHEKAVLINLAFVAECQFTFAILFIQGRCSDKEFAIMAFSSTEDVSLIVGEKPIGGFFSIPDERSSSARKREFNKIIKSYKHSCGICKKYLDIMRAS